MNNEAKFNELLNKYISGSMEPGEISELFAYIESGEYEHVLEKHVAAHADNEFPMANLPPHRAQEIMLKILSSEKNTSQLIRMPARKRVIPRYLKAAVAAVLLLGTLAGFYEFHLLRHQKKVDFLAQNREALREQINTDGSTMPVRLEDGTQVTLKKGSKLSYPAHFSPARREVGLEGEAFFQVSRNAKSPFFVYCNNVVTQVLGTSFTIRSNTQKNEVEVAVVTGSVEVYENPVASLPTSNAKNSSAGVILTPNQRVVYQQDNRQFISSIVDIPLPILKQGTIAVIQPDEKDTAYEEVPLPKILSLLYERYGIEIMVENENLNKCLFTGQLKSESLYSQLDVICLLLNASYETKGTKILLKGMGCN